MDVRGMISHTSANLKKCSGKPDAPAEPPAANSTGVSLQEGRESK